MHTHRNGKKDCRVNVDGAPTVFCFHSSCIAAVSEANRRLRREIGASPWQITLPGGRVLRNGDLLRTDGTVLGREAMMIGTPPHPGPLPRWGRGDLSAAPVEKVVLETVRVNAERYRAEMFEAFRWTYGDIMADSPLRVCERDAEDQFRTWLRLWPAHCHVWIGDVFSSGKPEHRTHFRPVAEWYQIGPAMGNFTCGSSFKPGSYSRSNANCDGTRFLVVESDTLAKDEVGAVFAYLNRRLRFNLHAIIDTAGKSLHGWFDAPRNARTEAHLKAVLTVFGCDPKLFTYSQPVRVPGAYRDGRLQRIVWLNS
ncbi:hypothetical protein NXS98_04055 [Fontisphaera persica]|uniref:hypothetical protein n=1 Tax=Fontisphaera persica TaxID=2974023 RepID=UPI0024BF6215|nr:hypothetical protein [Fontisphaera persica]WCJ60314.1 hypothetical protein NXS98_04055 [Fontisphaera persica]